MERNGIMLKRSERKSLALRQAVTNDTSTPAYNKGLLRSPINLVGERQVLQEGYSSFLIPCLLLDGAPSTIAHIMNNLWEVFR
jgi:hypothetical protein